MTQEEKDLVLRDLCARLPYNVWVSYKTKYDDIERATILNGNYVRDIMDGTSSWIDFKPYLRPMSSMTEEEKVEYGDLCYFVLNCIYENQQYCFNQLFDWLNKNMFDYRGLIEKGLANGVTKEELDNLHIQLNL